MEHAITVNTFSFDENSISFLYDYNNKTRISKTSDAALESFDKLVELEAKAKFLNESRKKTLILFLHKECALK